MARPAGKRLLGAAFRDVLRLKGISMTEAAERCGMSLTTMSGLVNGDHGASDKTIRQICDGLELSDSTLFPELAGFRYVTAVGDPEPVAVAS